MKKHAGEAEAIQHVLNQALLGSLVGTPVAQATGGADTPVSNTTLAGVLGGAAGLSGGVGAGKALAHALGGRGGALLPVLGGAAGTVGLSAAGGAAAKHMARKHKAEKKANLEPAAEQGGNALVALGRELAETGSVRLASTLGQSTEKLTPEELAQKMNKRITLQKTAAYELGYNIGLNKEAVGSPFSAIGTLVGALKNIKSFDNAGARQIRGVTSQIAAPAAAAAAIPKPAAVLPKVAVPEDTRAADWSTKQKALQSQAAPGGGALTQMLRDRAAKATQAQQGGKNPFAF